MSTKSASRPLGEGRVLFAAALFLILGIFNVIDGVAALAGDKHFIESELFLANLTFWGIVMVVTGAVQLLTSTLIFKRNANGQVLGIMLCCFNLVTMFFFVTVFPVWSLLIMGLDVMIIYALCIYDDHFH